MHISAEDDIMATEVCIDEHMATEVCIDEHR